MLDFVRMLAHYCIITIGKFFPVSHGVKTKKLLIVRTDSIGDLILFTPSFKYLKEHFDKYQIDIIVQNISESLLRNCPYVDKVLTFNYKKFRHNLFYKIRVLIRIRKTNYQICLNPAFSRNWASDEIASWTSAEIKIAWKSQINNKYAKALPGNNIYSNLIENTFSEQTHELERNKFFLRQMGVEITDYKPMLWNAHETHYVKDLWEVQKLDEKFVVCICPGTFTEYKKWDSRKFLNIITFINSKIENAFFLMVGTSNEKQILNQESLQNFPTLSLFGKTDLLDLFSIIQKSSLVLGFDSSPIHMAVIAETNSLCILGGGHFGRFMPYGDPEKHKFVYKVMPCYNCEWNCVYDNTKCIDDIDESSIITSLRNLLSKNSRN